jgi:hypothetical protein
LPKAEEWAPLATELAPTAVWPAPGFVDTCLG